MVTRYQTVSPLPWFGQSLVQGWRTLVGVPNGTMLLSAEMHRATLSRRSTRAHTLRTPQAITGMSGRGVNGSSRCSRQPGRNL